MANATFALQPLHSLTDAPENYDYSWQHTVNPRFATDSRGRTVRLCRNDDAWHLEQQAMRYGSGLHFCLTSQREVDSWIRNGLLRILPA